MKKSSLVIISVLLSVIFSACSSHKDSSCASGKKILTIGDTSFNAENEEYDINPHNAYSGWACIRYGVGETLFRLDENMDIKPWLAQEYTNIDPYTWKITLKDNVTFSTGKPLTPSSVKTCLLHLIQNHDRASRTLKIDSIQVQDNSVVIKTKEEVPYLINSLCDPFACMIDIEAMDDKSMSQGSVTGTGPYIAVELEQSHRLKLIKNPVYWDGDVHIDEINVVTITDSNTLALALQSGDIDIAYGMGYSFYPLFTNDSFIFASTVTSRAFFIQANYASPVMQDHCVRKAISLAINRKGFVDKLLGGYGYASDDLYDIEEAESILDKSLWIDTDGDGIREKDGHKLTVRYLTYPSRSELPLLAQMIQSSLRKIGIEVILDITSNHNTIVKDSSSWDMYASSFVTSSIGDPMYFFGTHCLKSSVSNRGGYYNEMLESYAKVMNKTFDMRERRNLADKMYDIIDDDNSFIFVSYLQMSMIASSCVKNLRAYPCDFYEVTADLDIER